MWNPRQGPRGHAHLRVVHNVASSLFVEIALDGKTILSNVGYKAVSDYLQVLEGHHVVTVSAGGSILIKANVNLAKGQDYTAIAHGNSEDLSSLGLLALEDNHHCPHKNKAHVRFIHAAAGAPNVDVYAGDTAVFKNVAYGSTGKPAYLPVMAGEVSVTVSPAGSEDVVVGPLDLVLEPRKTFTIIATGLVGDETYPLDAILISDNYCSRVHMH